MVGGGGGVLRDKARMVLYPQPSQPLVGGVGWLVWLADPLLHDELKIYCTAAISGYSSTEKFFTKLYITKIIFKKQ